MKLSLRAIPYFLLGFTLCGPGTSAAPADSRDPREVYQALNALRVDSAHIYTVNELRLRRDAVSLIFSTGSLGFLQAYDGRVTGIVFSGQGHVTAIPSDPAEKRSLAHFQGVPLLDRNFSKAYLRFDDGSGDEILADLNRDGVAPTNQPDFADAWDKTVANLNPGLSSRILLDLMAYKPAPFFYGELLDDQVGAFDVLVDSRRSDSVLIGQRRFGGGTSSYDVWASFAGSATPTPPAPAFNPVSYSIATDIVTTQTMTGTTTIDLLASRSGERAISLKLSRNLKVDLAEDAEGRKLDFFQDESLSENQIVNQGDDSVLLILPQESRAGVTYSIKLTYRGDMVGDAKNGTYMAGSRGSWYPRVSGMSHFVPYDMLFRWPKKFRLVATGEKVDERQDGDGRMGHWHSDLPLAVAGFNLGEFEIENAGTVDGVKLEVAANADFEADVSKRLAGDDAVEARVPDSPPEPRRLNPPGPSSIEADDASSRLKSLGVEIGKAVRQEKQWMGPFPFQSLVVSQVPGTLGQGWPGLLYLPTLSFLPPALAPHDVSTDVVLGTTDSVVLYHEIAHQWWGNEVGWDNYRDQWLTEGLASYISLVGADSEKPGAHVLTGWLEHYRQALVSTASGQDITTDEAGPLVHGERLNSYAVQGAYSNITYGKGAWVFHMLRMMMQEPGSTKPDERFTKLLRDLLETHHQGVLTTDDLQKAVEKVATPAMAVEGGRSMDWFFDEFVRSTGIPTYDIVFSSAAGPKGFIVKGKLMQQNVPDDFVLRVPIYAQDQGTKQTLLGYVVTSGEETPFQFTTPLKPLKLLIDPQMTLLCIPPAKP